MALLDVVLRVPLRLRNGHVQAWMSVDAADGPRVLTTRWSLRGGYARETSREGLLLHRVLMGLERGDRREVDHINRDKLDNRRSNLRVVTRAQNRQNLPSWGPTSEYRGVSWSRQHRKWYAHVKLDNRTRHVGAFDSELQAAVAAALYRVRHMPFSTETLA